MFSGVSGYGRKRQRYQAREQYMRSTKKVLVTLLITAVLASAALFANGAKILRLRDVWKEKGYDKH
jgi:hypothetical protein